MVAERCSLQLLVTTALALLVGVARAEISSDEARVRPAIDGTVGAWLVAGPLGKRESEALAAQPPSRERGRWRPIARAGGAFDLDRVLGAPVPSGSRVALAGVLRLGEPLDGLLLVGADGELEVRIDGSVRHTRSRGYLRGDTWDVVPLKLPAGDHPVVVVVRKRLPHFAALVRVVDRRDLSAPRGAVVVLPTATDAERDRLHAQLLSVQLDSGADTRGFVPVVTIDTPGGSVENVGRDVHVTLKTAGPPLTLHAGDLPLGGRGATPFDVTLPRWTPPGRVELTVSVGSFSETAKLELPEASPEALAAAAQAAEALRSAPGPGPTDAATLRATLELLTERVRDAPRTRQARLDAADDARALSTFADAIAAGRDPFADAAGVLEMAHVSPLDGAPHRFLLHVPPGPRGPPRPLVVILHGYRGSPEGIMAAFLDRKGSAPHDRIDGYVLAPEAFGDAFYRGPGEREVMDLVDWVRARYPIDDDRISITGVSMGGTGTAHLAFRYADRFAAAAPLAGYHSYFVRRDTRGKQTAPWERARMRSWSPASWAENGRNLPLYVAHGTRDLPLVNSRVLTDRYTELGYPLVAEWPESGHSVWRITYRGARMWSVLTSKRRHAHDHITLETDALRYGHRGWITLRELARPGEMAMIDADRQGNRAVIRTDGVAAFQAIPPAGVTEIEVDGERLSAPQKAPPVLVRREGRWYLGTTETTQPTKRAGLEGPLRDVFLEPLVFVVGTQEPETTRAHRELAHHFAARYGGSARYPIVTDAAATTNPSLVQGRSWFLVGPATSNRLTARVVGRLPIRVEGDTIVADGRRYRGPAIGALSIHPNPLDGERYVVILQAPDARGIWRAASLPKLLPDFVIYDDGVAPSTAEQILGDGHVIAAGFFDARWSFQPGSLPPSTPSTPSMPSTPADSAGASLAPGSSAD